MSESGTDRSLLANWPFWSDARADRRCRFGARAMMDRQGCVGTSSDSLLEGDGFEISVRGHGESVDPVIASFLCRPLASVGFQPSIRRPARSGRASIAVVLTPRLKLSATGERDQAACLHRRWLSRSRLAPRIRSAARCVPARSSTGPATEPKFLCHRRAPRRITVSLRGRPPGVGSAVRA